MPVLTLAEFAALPPAWPEYLDGPNCQSMLIARIHPDCNRSEGDEDVLARALVFDVPPGGNLGPATLRRITIRKCNLIPTPISVPVLDNPTACDLEHLKWDVELQRRFAENYCRLYADVLQAILTLPVIRLT